MFEIHFSFGGAAATDGGLKAGPRTTKNTTSLGAVRCCIFRAVEKHWFWL